MARQFSILTSICRAREGIRYAQQPPPCRSGQRGSSRSRRLQQPAGNRQHTSIANPPPPLRPERAAAVDRRPARPIAAPTTACSIVEFYNNNTAAIRRGSRTRPPDPADRRRRQPALHAASGSLGERHRRHRHHQRQVLPHLSRDARFGERAGPDLRAGLFRGPGRTIRARFLPRLKGASCTDCVRKRSGAGLAGRAKLCQSLFSYASAACCAPPPRTASTRWSGPAAPA